MSDRIDDVPPGDTAYVAVPEDTEEADNLLAACMRGACDLETIFANYGVFPCIDYVVRWCTVCGSIIVDKDDAGRTFSGAVMKMKRPEIAKFLKK